MRDNYEIFLNKFGGLKEKKYPNILMAKILTSYSVALGKAVDKIEGTNRFSEPKLPINITPIKNLDKIEDLPF